MDCQFGSVKALVNGVSNSDDAMKILKKLAIAVQPLIKRNNWRVGCLLEFYPSHVNLLGLNVNNGQKIMIRLRSGQNKLSFLPYESVLGTLIHELIHIRINARSFEFYELFEKLRSEVEMDIFHGSSGNKNSMAKATTTWASTSSYRLGSSSTDSSSSLLKPGERAAQSALLRYYENLFKVKEKGNRNHDLAINNLMRDDQLSNDAESLYLSSKRAGKGDRNNVSNGVDLTDDMYCTPCSSYSTERSVSVVKKRKASELQEQKEYKGKKDSIDKENVQIALSPLGKKHEWVCSVCLERNATLGIESKCCWCGTAVVNLT